MVDSRPVAFIEGEIESWTQFVGLIDAALEPEHWSPLKPSRYIFRGQADASWPLRPSLLRGKMAGLNAVEALEIEQGAVKAFRVHAHQHLDAATLQAAPDVVSVWGLMQHYGAPTRLLDWTASPYVAAYFAVERNPDAAGTIWVAHTDTINTHSGKIPARRAWVERLFSDPLAEPRVYVIRLTSETPRMAAADSVRGFGKRSGRS
jgi:hypothetical protein